MQYPPPQYALSPVQYAALAAQWNTLYNRYLHSAAPCAKSDKLEAFHRLGPLYHSHHGIKQDKHIYPLPLCRPRRLPTAHLHMFRQTLYLGMSRCM